MNWNLVLWFAGVMITFIGLKFVWVLFRTLFSKESMEDVVDAIGDGIHNTSKRMANSIKKSAQKRRAKKKAEKIAEKKKQDPPLIMIR